MQKTFKVSFISFFNLDITALIKEFVLVSNLMSKVIFFNSTLLSNKSLLQSCLILHALYIMCRAYCRLWKEPRIFHTKESNKCNNKLDLEIKESRKEHD